MRINFKIIMNCLTLFLLLHFSILLYDKTPILSSKFYEFLEKKHPGKNIDYWNQVKNDTLKKLSQSRKSYNDLPEP